MVTDVVIRVRFTITWVMSRVLVFREGLGVKDKVSDNAGVIKVR